METQRTGQKWVLGLLFCLAVAEVMSAGIKPYATRRQSTIQVQDKHSEVPHYKEEKPSKSIKPNADKVRPPSHLQVHAGKREIVHRPLKEPKRVPVPYVQEEHYVFTSNEYPENLEEFPSIGNGHVSTPLHGPWIHMNGLYNEAGVWSHRAEIPSTVAFNITDPDGDATRVYTLNAYEGTFTHELTGSDYTLTHRLYAHRSLTQVIAVEVEVDRTTASGDLSFTLVGTALGNSSDIEILSEDSDLEDVRYIHGRIHTPETPTSGLTEVFIYYDAIPDIILIPDGVEQAKFYLLTSVSYSQEKARVGYVQGSSLIDQGQLLSTHTGAWANLWQNGRVTLSGTNDQMARAIWGSFYYILSSVPDQQDPDWDYIGLSPAGLPHGRLGRDYQGHIFWDQELWMYPPVLALHSDIGKILVESRTRVQDAAQENAALNGWEGLQYPWEGAFTGTEVCPAPEPLEYQHHITGDIAFAALQYLYATHDLTMLEGQQLDRMLPGIADFWASRTLFNEETGQYEIWRVMGPDEWHYNVNNSVFTNVIAKISMEAAKYALSLVGQDETRWDDYIENMYIPFDEEIQYHPQFDGYTPDIMVKQADVVLLGYPLLHEMTEQVRFNDLEIYQASTDDEGPAMTWSMFAIGWLELKEFDRANEMTDLNYRYIYNAFQVWRETRVGIGAANFITGMGGFLQNVMNGYGGLRLLHDRLDFEMILPPDVTEFTMAGVDYLGSSLDLVCLGEEIQVTLMQRESGSPFLRLLVYEGDEFYDLELGQTVVFLAGRAAIISPENLQVPKPR